jgi:hypothetical protein
LGAAKDNVKFSWSKEIGKRGLIHVLNCCGESSLEKESATNTQNVSRFEFAINEEFVRVFVFTRQL